jgi:hypothetical protein
MNRILLVALALAVPVVCLAITEPKTKTEYPDQLTAGDATLVTTGVGLREKTFAKVDVYVIVSYVAEGTDLGDDPGRGLRTADVPKRIQMDLRRGFSRKKLIDAFESVIKKNYDDRSAFAADMETFFAYFDRDAEDRDQIIFDYVPGQGLTTTLNGEVKGTIDNLAFVEALWTVWFGEKPASGGLKKDLLKAISMVAHT